MKKIVLIVMIALFICMALLFSVSMAEGTNQKPILIKSVKVKDAKMRIPIGESKAPVIEIKPENASNKSFEWTSSDENICIVDENGIITAISEGKCNIEGITADGSKKKVKIAVTTFIPGPPILFRDIPWCSNMAESIEKGSFSEGEYWFSNPNAYKSWYTADAINNCYHDSGVQTGYSVSVWMDVDVAGYKVSGPWLVFAIAYWFSI